MLVVDDVVAPLVVVDVGNSLSSRSTSESSAALDGAHTSTRSHGNVRSCQRKLLVAFVGDAAVDLVALVVALLLANVTLHGTVICNEQNESIKSEYNRTTS